MAIKRAEEGAWVFLSHSTKDFVKVSGLRNDLEAKGHRPLMFFLKCLDDDCEIDDLIKREIKARTWFILCQSKSAKSSRWVQSEVAFVKSLPGKVYNEVDLDQPLTAQLQAADPLLRRASVFISHAAADSAVANALTTALRAQDFGVFTDLDLAPSTSWETELRSRLREAVDRGFVILLITPAFVRSRFGLQEAHTALTWSDERQHRANVVPVYVGISLDELSVRGGAEIGRIARRVQGFQVPGTPERPAEFLALVEHLKRARMQ